MVKSSGGKETEKERERVGVAMAIYKNKRFHEKNVPN